MPKAEYMHLRATPEVKQQLTQKAAEEGKTLSQYLITAGLERQSLPDQIKEAVREVLAETK